VLGLALPVLSRHLCRLGVLAPRLASTSVVLGGIALVWLFGAWLSPAAQASPGSSSVPSVSAVSSPIADSPAIRTVALTQPMPVATQPNGHGAQLMAAASGGATGGPSTPDGSGGGGSSAQSTASGAPKSSSSGSSSSGGASSSGTGAGMAAWFGTVGLGSDTGGSITIPTAQNNLVGFATTHGLVSRTGQMWSSPRQENGGPMGRSVYDCAAVLDAIAGYDPADLPTQESIGKIPEKSATIRRESP